MNYSQAGEEGDRASDAIIRGDGERVRKGAKKGDEELEEEGEEDEDDDDEKAVTCDGSGKGVIAGREVRRWGRQVNFVLMIAPTYATPHECRRRVCRLIHARSESTCGESCARVRLTNGVG